MEKIYWENGKFFFERIILSLTKGGFDKPSLTIIWSGTLPATGHAAFVRLRVRGCILIGG